MAHLMISDTNYIRTIESPWFAGKLIQAACAGYLSYYGFSEGIYSLGVPAALWVLFSLLTSVEVGDRRKP